MNLKAILLDMDGVLWHDTQPIGDLPRLFERMKALGLQIALATNNATRTPDEYVQKLADFGVQVEKEQIVSAAMATGALLAADFPRGGDVYVVGMRGLREAVQEAGFNVLPADALPEQVTAVAAGLDIEISYPKLARATILIRRGAPFYGSNPDLTFPTPYGQAPGAGAILAAITAATDVQPKLAGKPQPYIFQLALRRLGIQPEEAVMVGDRLETDIAGGQNAGLKTALVLSGVSDRTQAAAWSPPPDWIVRDLSAFLDLLEKQA